MTIDKLKDASTHFAFGENWSEYAKHIDETRIEEARKGLLRLLKHEEIEGKTFLDIGCGSGLHSLAALKLGVASVVATDIDVQSVATTREVLKKNAPPNVQYVVQEISVFDLPDKVTDRFDIVYSWGVLHHTGDLYEALGCATRSVRPGGYFAFALYRKTWLCGLWKWIKRWYAHTTTHNQDRARRVYIWLLALRYRLLGKDFAAHKKNYLSSRGMSFEHDVHDWMGGYPYESITPEEVHAVMQRVGFTHVRSYVHRGGVGLFGSGCDEYVFKKPQDGTNKTKVYV